MIQRGLEGRRVCPRLDGQDAHASKHFRVPLFNTAHMITAYKQKSDYRTNARRVPCFGVGVPCPVPAADDYFVMKCLVCIRNERTLMFWLEAVRPEPVNIADCTLPPPSANQSMALISNDGRVVGTDAAATRRKAGGAASSPPGRRRTYVDALLAAVVRHAIGIEHADPEPTGMPRINILTALSCARRVALAPRPWDSPTSEIGGIVDEHRCAAHTA